jgi:hypothetical protein
MPLLGRHLVCTCGRPVPAASVRPGLVCGLCGRDLNTYYWDERERIAAEELATRGKGRPPQKHYYL